MHDYAQDLGFNNPTDLFERTKVLHYSNQTLKWYLTDLGDGRWAAWNSLDNMIKNYKYFSSYDEAKEYIDRLYYSVQGYPLHLANIGAKLNIKCKYCQNNLHMAFIHESEGVAWLLCPHIDKQEEKHESLAVPLSMTKYSA
ncbi:hypothetical protein SCACP_22630 [Sporomusa carbonis]|uniref:hypothetical protein n=1 Tax=Sporomusa carbonis TaxID=3076075 RepID=UPI003A7A6525